MTDEDSRFRRWFERLRAPLFGILSLVYLLFQIAAVLAGNLSLAVSALVFALLVALFGVLGHITFSRARSVVLIPATARPGAPRFRFSREVRVGAITVGVLFVLGAAAVGWLVRRQEPHSSEDFVVVVSQFEGPHREEYRVQETIITSLQEELGRYPGFEVIEDSRQLGPWGTRLPGT